MEQYLVTGRSFLQFQEQFFCSQKPKYCSILTRPKYCSILKRASREQILRNSFKFLKVFPKLSRQRATREQILEQFCDCSQNRSRNQKLHPRPGVQFFSFWNFLERFFGSQIFWVQFFNERFGNDEFLIVPKIVPEFWEQFRVPKNCSCFLLYEQVADRPKIVPCGRSFYGNDLS